MKEKKHHSLVPLNRKKKFYTSSSIISDYQKNLWEKQKIKTSDFEGYFLVQSMLLIALQRDDEVVVIMSFSLTTEVLHDNTATGLSLLGEVK